MIDLSRQESNPDFPYDSNKMPVWMIYLTLFLCFIPFVLTLIGMDFSTRTTVLDVKWAQTAGHHELVDATFHSLRGAFTHSLLEWSALCVAVFVAVLSLSHYRVTGDVTTPIIGVAFFMAGCMDGFHTLAADRLIEAVADNRDLVPFSWAICRMFNALIMIAGVLILVKRSQTHHTKPGIRFVIVISAVFGVIAYGTIHYLATASDLPKTTFTDALITRPYDVIPLVLFVISGVFVYPYLYKRFPSLFAHALIISSIPQIVTQIHVTFGSIELFDSHFNIAHYTKVVAYLVPLMGLFLDYVRSQQAVKDSEGRQRAVVETMVDGLITISERGIIETCNKAAERLFGYPTHEMVGCNIKMLMPEPYHSQHDGYLQRYNKTGEAHIIGIGREVTGKRKDDSTFPMGLAVAEMHVSGKRVYSGIVRDLTEQQKIDRMKNEFISTVSHELRTPLTSISGALGLLLGGAMGEFPDKAKNMLQMASRNSDRLTLLINDILDLEKIESGSMEFDFKTVNLVTVVEHAIEANQGYAHKHGIGLNLQPGMVTAMVKADDHRILQVMANLISNAVKYSPENGCVEVSVAQQLSNIRVSVQDHGSGIPEEFHARIFQRFSQADSSDTREKGGTGLGLSITKAIIEHHGGNISFESVVGEGTVFHFDLPEYTALAELTDGAKAAAILICEDNADVARVLSRLLEQEGLSNDIAYTAKDAKAMLAKRSYRALMLDLGLPDQDGLSFIQQLKQDEANSDLPIIVVSALAKEGRRQFTGDVFSVVDWIQKPVDHKRLINALNQAMNKTERPRILHIEDSADVIEIVKAIVKDMADYDYVMSLQDAREKLEKQSFDLLIVDVNLPDGSGLELVSELHGRYPVIVFSGQEIDAELKKNISAILTKSTTSNEQLLTTIKQVINEAPERN